MVVEVQLLARVSRPSNAMERVEGCLPAHGPPLAALAGRVEAHQCHVDALHEAARHIPGASGHELSLAANRHFSIPTLNEAIADLVNAHARLDISQAWGDGSTVAADGPARC
ncbi:Tn3 family transposase [Streptomyces sp. 205]|uniref:Tn3 family transposase n=1 Tax=Streptomyces coffeae TaxID=621382 RepID=A0ABS1NNX0_9ACTN|nr:Tn3 family transposase [Streptomyces coffeae]